MKLLVLGGRKFLGRATVEAALERGHAVTLFNRGQTNPGLFPEAEELRGDRAIDLSALDGHSWDAVVDTSGYVPHVVRASAEALAGSVEQYLFISSISVYTILDTPSTEGDPRKELEEGQSADRLAEDYSNYGALKALCEQAVEETLPERHAIVRPGLIVGPHDPTGRFTYWPHRVARGGDVVVPAPPHEKVQFIDVRDLAAWLVDLCERRERGTFNATGPGTSWQELVETCRDVSGSEANFVWIEGDFLLEQGVEQWMGLPMWLHEEELRGMHQADISRALAAGLAFRSLSETIRATLDQAGTTGEAGLTPEQEAEVLEAWRRR